MNKIDMWTRINTYFREGVIVPVAGDYINKIENGVFEADLIGSMILAHIGPRQFDVKEMPAIEPGVVSDLIKVYSPREIAIIECAYENQIFGWDKPYLSQKDNEAIVRWIYNPDYNIQDGSIGSTKDEIRARYKMFVNKMIEFDGDIHKLVV